MNDAPDEPALDAAPSLARLKVLVVDAEPVTRLTVRLILEAAGAEVTSAASPADALQALALRPFDALVMDGAGPGATLPVIPITARGAADSAGVLGPGGMKVEIGRPIDPADLFARLAALTELPARAAAD